jgi:hypothetical protein
LNEFAPGSAGLANDAVRRWRSFWDSAVRTCARGVGGGLKAEVSADYDPDAVAALIARTERVIVFADAVQAVEAAAKLPRVSLPIGDAIEAENLEQLKRVVNRWITAINASEADQEGNKVIAFEGSLLVRSALIAVDHLLDEGDVAEAAPELERLEAARRALPDLAERRDLLAGEAGKLKATVAAIEEAALESSTHPRSWGTSNVRFISIRR